MHNPNHERIIIGSYPASSGAATLPTPPFLPMDSLLQLCNASPVPTACVDASGHIHGANSALCQAWNVQSEAALLGDLVVARIPQRAAAVEIATALRTHAPWARSIRGCLPDVASNMVVVSPYPIAPEGRLWLLVQFLPALDGISQEDVVCTESALIVAFEGLRDGVVLLDAAGRIDNLNRRAVEMLGASRGALCGADLDSQMTKSGANGALTLQRRMLSDGRSVGYLHSAGDVARPEDKTLDALALQGAGGATWAWDVRTGTVEYGWSWRKVFGEHMPAGSGTLEQWRQAVHPDDASTLTAQLETALCPDSECMSFELRLRLDDTRFMWVLVRAAVVSRMPSGAPAVVAGTLLPFDSWHAREAKLIEAEARSRAIYNECFQFVGLLDTEGRVLEANRTSLDFVGVAAAQVIGKPFWETPWWAHSEAAAKTLRIGIARAANGEFVRFETSHPAADGSLIYVDFSLKPLFNTDGQVIYLLPEGREITERRHVEEALRKSEARFRSYFELNLIGMAMTSPIKGWLQVNDRLCQILGYNRDELASLTWAAITYPDDLQTDEALFDRVLAGEIDGYDLEKRFVRKDGTIIDTSISVKCLRQSDGKVDYFVSLIQDISDRKRAEEERLVLDRKLLHAQKLESLGIMAGGIAHDFNNLLTAISGNLELATMDLGRESTSRIWIARAEHAAQRAADLTRQMLAYSGKGRFLVQHLDLNELVEQNAALFRATVAKNVNVELILAPALPRIFADQGQVQQVLMNLITNAAEAIGGKDGLLRIATGAAYMTTEALQASLLDQKPVPGAYVFLEVVDDGCGMDAMTRERLFDPFFTTKFTGRGLGMSAVLGILRGHEGALLMHTRPGAGTSIRVLFPAPAATMPTEEAQALPNLGSEADEPMDKTVLLVDDEEIVRQLGSHLLEHMGARVLTAADGQEAVRMYSDHRQAIDVVLMDLSMPRMNGIAAAAKIKAIEPSVRILLASGFSEEDALSRFHLSRPDHFVQKPYSYQGLRLALQRVLAE